MMTNVRRWIWRATRLVALIALIGTAVLVAFGSAAVGPPATPARAATAFVRNLGTANGVVSPLLLITTGAVQAGDSIIVVVGVGDNSVTPQCSDPVNGAYSIDAVNSAAYRVALCAIHISQALPAGTTITISAPTSTELFASAMEFTGLAPTPVDRTADTGAASIFLSTGTLGPVSTTSQANEVLIAGFYYGGGPTNLTPGTNGTANACAETATSTFTAGITATSFLAPKLTPMYCTVSAQGAYSASASSLNNSYTAVLVTYRLAGPPTVTTTGSALTYTTGGTATPVDSGLTVFDGDSANLTSATISITGGFSAAVDSLGFTNQNGITGNYNAGTGVLTLTGTATLAQYEAALRSVTYTNSSATTSLATRTVTFQVTDDQSLTSNAATRDITIPTPTATLTPSPTGTLAPTGTATATPNVTATATVTATGTPTPTLPPVKEHEDNQDKHRSLSEAERRERDKTNKSGHDDVHTEGQVVGVEPAPDGASLLVTIALGPGGNERITIQVACENGRCPSVQYGDLVVADGYQNGVGDPNTYFVATDGFEVTRDGQRIR